MSEIETILWAICAGAGSGTLAGLIGYFKNYNESTGFQNLDHLKLIQTVLIGCGIGGLAGYMGVDYNTVLQFGTTIGLTVVLENVGKAIYRYLRPKFKR
jgi:hypothetical protein